MRNVLILFAAGAAILLCGCNKQAKINSEKIDLLSQKLVQMDEAQSKQMGVLQAELVSLAPQLDKMNSEYFEKNRDDALFFHTNTLYLLLTIGKQIEAQLANADTERSAQNAEIYNYHTNQMAMAYLCTAQIEDSLTAHEGRLETNFTMEINQASAALKDLVQQQIKLASTPDAAEQAWRKQTEEQLTQLQHDLEAIKAQLAAQSPATATNPPATP